MKLILLLLTAAGNNMFGAACASGTLQDYINLSSTGCTLSTSGAPPHASAPITVKNFTYSLTPTGSASSIAAASINVAPNPGGTGSNTSLAGLLFLNGQTSGQDPGILAAPASGSIAASIKFTVEVANYPTAGILSTYSDFGALVFSTGSSWNVEQLLCVGALFGTGASCSGWMSFDDKYGSAVVTNMAATLATHGSLKDSRVDPMTGNPLHAPGDGVGLIDVILLLTVNGATGGNVGVETIRFYVEPNG